MNLETVVAALTLPGLPAWTGAVALGAIALVALCFVLMPFSIYGLRSRLEGMEAQLDEMQAELRAISARLTSGPPPRAGEVRLSASRAPAESAPSGRQEPRLNWPGHSN
ncbi:hypothetical protein EOD42_06235 [Rhodovarius crocodyli]|uniref:Uncharacterized protein n=1 Tax=Rhodovarius crocodyli TaxID=1979269 RepID=A0A437MIE7_9PROT|nr:hypothetical protein [Rhodovarius crocodyli]RVT97428.1 hypothetical protein EOD42_06235 [Rhodovarius crocodyli]